MTRRLGFASAEALVDAAIPPAIRNTAAMALPAARSEAEALRDLRSLASRNQVMRSMIGQGWYDTWTPAVIRRNLLENPAWYTAYTPYQPEISQGRLELLLVFQTMVADLTGMDLAGASMLDEATAAAEAMTMAARARPKGSVFVVDPDCHPQVIEVVRTRAQPLGIEIALTDAPVEGVFGGLIAYPGSSGNIADLGGRAAAFHAADAVVCVAADLLACCRLEAPGALGADIVVGSAQRFGVPMGFGGPHAGFLATRESFARSLPGRLVGVSVDANGRRALRLALQTREQHIRREKATSNICTAQVLLAEMAAAYAMWHGPDGLAAIADRVHGFASELAAYFADCRVHDCWFDTITLRVPENAAALVAAAADRGVNVRLVDADTVGLSCDETTTAADLAALKGAAATLGIGGAFGVDRPQKVVSLRTAALLPHPEFSAVRSETDMMRILRRWSDLDLALDRTMIPLGSCTMKLNAAAELEPISWPEFANMHPFAPPSQTEGYATLIADVESWLAEITGYDRVSVQPNAGSQGEYAGLLAIRNYFGSRRESHRDICLIPASAHGTNAASAALAGLRVVVVACLDEPGGTGEVDLAALRKAIDTHRDRLAAIMVTYPSTHGVYEGAIMTICDLVHEAGGQVYVDGANLNALVGLARPGAFGADVSHLNLHKTFCIPHGGGGPGVGPVCVRAHLAPFLESHISAAPFGSAGILPITWMYIAMMGPDGLRAATVQAVLNANYVAHRLHDSFPVLYRGERALVAHECILDLRPLTKATGVTVDDVAKRLIDYGFHAPTMSFPVPGTLMVEPTESEGLAELDRFCDAMIAIRADAEAHPEALKHAPHTLAEVTADIWNRPYPRSRAHPTNSPYWPPVARIDGTYGDRNLFCSCALPEAD